MPKNRMRDEEQQRGQDQVNMRVYENDRVHLEHLQTVTGLGTRSDVIRYALKYTADRHPISLPPDESINPTLLRDIAGFTALLRAFFATATEHMDKESDDYRTFVEGILRHIGDPLELCSLFAVNLPASMVVLRSTPATHFQYEMATKLLVLNGTSLDERTLAEEEGGTHLGRRSYRLYLEDLLEIYLDRLKQYQEPGEFTNFVTRLSRYAQITLLPKKGQ